MERLRPILEALVAFLAPGLVLMLLGIQVAFGLRGFDQPAEGLLLVLQVPGALLGWGGVLLLLPLLVWLVLDWWGFEAPGGDLGGLALKGLGSAVLGIAGGALFGLAGGTALGGMIGGALASVLGSALGTVVSVLVLGLMAAPACVLALSLQKRPRAPASAPTDEVQRSDEAGDDAPSERPAAAGPTATGPEPTKRGGTSYGFLAHLTGMFRRQRTVVEQRWYPKQRFDAWGNELPMDFRGQRDVGGIRFVDDDPADVPADMPADMPGRTTGHAPETKPDDARVEAPAGPTTIADLLADEERLPTIPELLSGNYNATRPGLLDDPSGGPRELAADEAEDGPVHVNSEGRPDDAPRRAAPAAPAPPAAPASAPAPPETPASVPAPQEDDVLAPVARSLAFAPADPRHAEVEEALPAGVRYAEPPPPEAPAPDESGAEDEMEHVLEAPFVLSQVVRDAVRGPAITPQDTAHTRKTIRDTLRARVQTIRADAEHPAGGKSRYLQKLEALGMFEPADPLPEAPKKKPAKRTAARKKVAPKRAPPKTAKKPPAAKPKATAKKKAATKKKAAAKKKAPPKKKPAAGRKPAGTRASARPAPAAKKAARKATKKSATATQPRPPKAAVRRKITKPPTQLDDTQAQAQARAHEAMLEGLRIERLDPLFARAVEAALERGAVSPVLLTRRLGLPFARASALLERMEASGVIGPPSRQGASPLQISAKEWATL